MEFMKYGLIVLLYVLSETLSDIFEEYYQTYSKNSSIKAKISPHIPQAIDRLCSSLSHKSIQKHKIVQGKIKLKNHCVSFLCNDHLKR